MFNLRLLCFFHLLINVQSEFSGLNFRTPKSNTCENQSNTSLIERFFNIIFAEFHNSPPMCVCVQMCSNQPTYCYPNGCMRKVDTKSKTFDKMPASAPVPVEQDRYLSFVVGGPQESSLSNNNVDGNFVEDSRTVDTDDETPVKNIQQDLFKDRYTSIFRYNKIPKVGVKYNIRGQNKNLKFDSSKMETVDVSNTRWPTNKYIKMNGQQIYHNIRDRADEISKTKFFMTMLPDSGVVNYPQRYNKRDLPRNEDEVDVSVLYLLGQKESEAENASFSLEYLIDNLIEKGFAAGANNTKVNVTYLENCKDNRTDENSTTIDIVSKDNVTSDFNITNIISMNLKNEKTEENKYKDDFASKENLHEMVGEMIATLSKRIDRQNNTSMEFMEKFTDEKVVTTDSDILNTTVNSTETVMNETTTKAETEIIETTIDGMQTVMPTTTPRNPIEVSTRKVKRRHRSRRLKNKKN